MTKYSEALLSERVSFEKALHLIGQHGPVSASQLAQLLGVSVSAAWSVIWLLAAERYVQEQDAPYRWSPFYSVSAKGAQLIERPALGQGDESQGYPQRLSALA